MNGTLYRIFNISSGKSYIGKTYRDPYRRLYEHLRDIKKFPTRPLYRALSKYGPEAFSFEILGEYPEDVLELEEIKAVKTYNSFHNGYNATTGGDGSRYSKHSDQTIIESYLSLKSTKEVSRVLKVDAHRVSEILKSYNVPLIKGAHREIMINMFPKSILLVEHNIQFQNLTECAEYLIDNNISKTNIKSTKNGISKVLNKQRKSYLKLNFIEN